MRERPFQALAAFVGAVVLGAVVIQLVRATGAGEAVAVIVGWLAFLLSGTWLARRLGVR